MAYLVAYRACPMEIWALGRVARQLLIPEVQRPDNLAALDLRSVRQRYGSSCLAQTDPKYTGRILGEFIDPVVTTEDRIYHPHRAGPELVRPCGGGAAERSYDPDRGGGCIGRHAAAVGILLECDDPRAASVTESLGNRHGSILSGRRSRDIDRPPIRFAGVKRQLHPSVPEIGEKPCVVIPSREFVLPRRPVRRGGVVAQDVFDINHSDEDEHCRHEWRCQHRPRSPARRPRSNCVDNVSAGGRWTIRRCTSGTRM